MAKQIPIVPLALLAGAGLLVAVAAGSQKRIGGESDSDTGDGGDTASDDYPPPPGAGLNPKQVQIIPGKIEFDPKEIVLINLFKDTKDPVVNENAPPAEPVNPMDPEKDRPEGTFIKGPLDQGLCMGYGNPSGTLSANSFKFCGGINQVIADSLQRKGWFKQGSDASLIFAQLEAISGLTTGQQFAYKFNAAAENKLILAVGRLPTSPSAETVVRNAFNIYRNIRDHGPESALKKARDNYYKLSDPWRWAGLLYLAAMGNR